MEFDAYDNYTRNDETVHLLDVKLRSMFNDKSRLMSKHKFPSTPRSIQHDRIEFIDSTSIKR